MTRLAIHLSTGQYLEAADFDDDVIANIVDGFEHGTSPVLRVTTDEESWTVSRKHIVYLEVRPD